MCLHYKYVRRFQDREEAVCGQSEALSDNCEWLTGCETQGSWLHAPAPLWEPIIPCSQLSPLSGATSAHMAPVWLIPQLVSLAVHRASAAASRQPGASISTFSFLLLTGDLNSHAPWVSQTQPIKHWTHQVTPSHFLMSSQAWGRNTILPLPPVPTLGLIWIPTSLTALTSSGSPGTVHSAALSAIRHAPPSHLVVFGSSLRPTLTSLPRGALLHTAIRFTF